MFVFPVPFPTPIVFEMPVPLPLVLDPVLIVINIWSIGLKLKADVVAGIEHHGGGERHNPLPGASRQ